ncbi:hypothetical protein [Aquipuribacter sp. MA13-6]|uniref:hypothetical protein n=1 Tax=unclassified Aquipuribacter TaxID=2635084 RepID=UPI003EEADE62
MSKDRARRRAAREAQAGAARERAERDRLAAVERRRRRDARARALRRTLGLQPTRVRSATRRAAVRRWVPVVVVVVAAHVLLWVLVGDVRTSLVALGVTLLASPVLWVLVTDSARGRRTGYRRRP